MKPSKNNLLILATLLLFLIVIPIVTNAFSLINPDECSGNLCIPVGAKYCTICDGLKVVQGGMTFLIELGIAVAVLFITYGAILIMVGGAMPAKIQEGKKAITASIVGVILMLMAWIIVNQVFFLFVNKSITNKPWNKIDCPAEETIDCILGPGASIAPPKPVVPKCDNNGTCDAGENPAGCPADCKPNVCGNNVCEQGENSTSCVKDCPATGPILTDSEARSKLTAAGVTVNKPNCTSPTQTSCTSLDGLSSKTVDGLIKANEACKASGSGNCVVVTAGTEAGHKSHGADHPNTVDVRYNSNALQAFESSGISTDAKFNTGVTCEPEGGGSTAIPCGPNAKVMHIEFP